ncbi:helix-turn-helix transcriptional regulator [Bradyrhizobium sp. SSUT112]|uniref:helix-turn-helix transcriptional regulator n=1 Tax=Bradyrhizobium sp. SSUT112 TaxID=3040604 RepID=UPI002448BA38|nr:helix-turn-helix transcriptional regulator [Bradyrhizobium sp. SSUT112]MDH2352588.1 helix-turn-helix transcriptional regulator [Bradyrhizobium sp. SSUT112]
MKREKEPIEVPNHEQPTQVLNVPAYFLYGENWSGSIFGFFHIEELFVRNAPNKWHIALHRHLDFDQLSILLSGHCTFEHDGVSRRIEAPNCVYTPANVVHQFDYSSAAVGFVISVSPDFVVGLPSVEGATNTVLLRLAEERVVALEGGQQVTTVRKLLELISEKAASRNPYRRDALRYLYGSLLLELGGTLMSPSQNKMPQASTFELDLFKRYRELIGVTLNAIGFADDQRTNPLTVELFAQRLSATPYTLNLACQHISGIPARDVLQAAVLEQATRLLLYTTKPVKEISFLLGYSHASHFARFFKQRRGATPEAFRRACTDGPPGEAAIDSSEHGSIANYEKDA